MSCSKTSTYAAQRLARALPAPVMEPEALLLAKLAAAGLISHAVMQSATACAEQVQRSLCVSELTRPLNAGKKPISDSEDPEQLACTYYVHSRTIVLCVKNCQCRRAKRTRWVADTTSTPQKSCRVTHTFQFSIRRVLTNPVAGNGAFMHQLG